MTKASLATTLKTSSIDIASGGNVNLTLQLTPLDASAVPVAASGTVTFTDTTTGTTLGTSNVAYGQYGTGFYYLATLGTTSITTAGANTITASYSGDANYAGSSATVTVTVAAGLSMVTASTLTSTNSPDTVASTDTLTFTITAYSGASPTGTVYWYDGTQIIGQSSLATRVATLNVRSLLTAGTNNLTAVYAGSSTYQTYTSPVLPLQVNKATPTLNLSVKSGSVLGSSATLTVLITVPASTAQATYNVPYIAPTGTMQYYDNGSAIGGPVAITPPVLYANGGNGLYETIYTTGVLAPGNHTITATFTDNNYATTTTNSQTITIAKETPGLTVSSPSAVYPSGASISLTGVLTVPATTAAPTGMLTFFDGSNSLGMAPLTASGSGMYSATLTGVTSLMGGTHSITAQYAGDANYTNVTSPLAFTIVITTNNVWIANGNNSVSALTAAGTAVTPSAVSGGGTAIAIDNTGDVWSLNANSVAEFSNTGAVISAGYTGGGVNAPTALTIDGAGQVWVTNGNNTISVLSSTGTPVSATPYTSLLAAPTTISVDGSGNLWVTNAADSSVTEVIGVAAPVMTPQSTAVKNNTLAARP